MTTAKRVTVDLPVRQAEALLSAAYRGRDEWAGEHDDGMPRHSDAGPARLACIKVANEVAKAKQATR